MLKFFRIIYVVLLALGLTALFVIVLPTQATPRAAIQIAIRMGEVELNSTYERASLDELLGYAMTLSADWIVEGDKEYAWLGWSVGTAGDVNGDGYDDVIVGAYGYDSGMSEDGRVYVFYGNPVGLSTDPDWTVGSDQAGAHFGQTVGTAGDVNGDGYDDVIIGAPNYINDQGYAGRAYVYHGSADGLSTIPVWTVENELAYSRLGVSVRTAGDVNGDGFSDVIIGLEGGGNMFEVGPGRAYVYHGGADGLNTTSDWMVIGDQNDTYFGDGVGTTGDVNGDGYSDVFVAARNYDNGQEDEGRVFVYHGSAVGLSITPAWMAEGDQQYANYGWSVDTAGDVNDDSYSDLIVGGYYFNGLIDEGRAHVYHGSAGGLTSTPAWEVQTNQAGDQFSRSVGTAGDVDGDGYSDVIIGAPIYNNDTGRAYVYHGADSGLSITPSWKADGSIHFGMVVGLAGDVNGDGYSDVIVGEPDYNGSYGRAYVFHGSANGLQDYYIYLPLTLR